MPLVQTALGLLASLAVSAAGEAPPDLHARFYEAWLHEVAPLMRPDERAAFDGLTSDAAREAFVRRFWKVRDPTPGTGRNELRDRWQSGVAELAADEAAGPDQAAAMRLLGARPRLLHRIVDCPPLPRMEVWYFSRDWAPPLVADPERAVGSAEPFYLLFAWDPEAETLRQVSPGEVTVPWDEDDSLAERLDTVLRKKRCLLGVPGTERALSDLELAFARALDWGALTEHVGVPAPPPRWFEGLAPEPTLGRPGPELELAFPGRVGGETVVRGLVRLPSPSEAGGGAIPAEGVALAGEVFQLGLVESFRYTFHGLGEDVRGTPLRFERTLAPGPYGLRLRLEDLDGSLLWSETREIRVPKSDDEVPPGGDPARYDAFEALVIPDRPALRLLVPGPGLLVDRVTVAASLSGFGGSAVRFYLDGRRVGEDAEPPFEIELDLGERPRRHGLRAVAVDAEGRTVAEDRAVLNAGPHRFAVRLADLPPGTEAGPLFTARVDLDLPAGTRLDRLVLQVNGETRATLYGPPFVQTLPLPGGEGVVFVQAVAYLTDGRTAEDVTVVRGGRLGEEVDVQLVELYTTVLGPGGRPVTDLAAGDFAVYDEGERQSLHGFRKLEEIPLHVCLAVDTSASMVRSMDTVRESAVAFFERVLTPRDQAALVAFNHLARVVAPLTRDLEDLERSAHDLQAGGGTALYDALLLSLHYLGGLEGKRAVVLLSDGHDEHSHFELADVQEYARRAGVAVYTIALGNDRRLRPLRRLARDTGGLAYTVRRAEELPAVYDEIERELRAQYLLTYQAPEGEKDGFRRVEVRVSRPRLEARTLAGYYPE